MSMDDAESSRLATIDRFLPVWILLAMVGGLVLGSVAPAVADALNSLAVGSVSIPIALGLLMMMYPVLAKVRYERLGALRGEHRLFAASLVLNWVLGPLLMFTLAWVFLPDEPAYRTGLVIVGLARCIAMVLIWNQLARGDNDTAAVLVAINSLFQIAAYSFLAWFYLTVLPGWLGLDQQGVDISLWEVARTVLIFLGIPLLAGYLTRRIGVERRGLAWYDGQFIPRIAPFALYGLLYTIVVLFALQGDAITNQPVDVIRIALPLLVYFATMFFISFATGRALGFAYDRTATLAFTAASNNFELAIAVAIGVFGATSGEALAGVVGPLIEVPALVGLVYVSLWLGRRWFGNEGAEGEPPLARRPMESGA